MCFEEIEKPSIKFMGNLKESQITEKSLANENEISRFAFSYFKMHYVEYSEQFDTSIQI